MVAITVILAAVVYLLVSGVMGPPPPGPASVSLSNEGGWVDGNYTAAVVSATGVEAVPANGLTYIVRDQDRAAYLSGPANTPQTTNSITTTIFYVDTNDDNRVTGGDIIRIQVEPSAASAAFDGGVFELHYDGNRIALQSL
jgi:hypothetical protein